MQRSGAPRSIMVWIVFVFVFSMGSLTALADDAPSHIWFSDHKALKSIDISTNRISGSIALDKAPKAIGADAAGNVWAAHNSRLLKFDPAGKALIDLDLTRFDGKVRHPRFLAVNPYRGSVWVASNHDVMLITESGDKAAEWRADGKIEDIALDIDESLWVMGRRELTHLSPSGALLRKVAIDNKLSDPSFMVIDGLGGALWVVAKRKLLKFDISRPDVPSQLFDLPAAMRAMDVHPVFGTLWLSGDKELLMVDRNGQALTAVALPSDIGRVNDLRYDVKGSALWIAGKDGLFRLTTAGEWQATIAVDKKADLLAVAGFRVSPTLAIVNPADGALTNDPRPRIELSLGASCSGVPCLLPSSYLESIDLDIQLNGSAIGPLFGGPAAEPTYLPPSRLPEGPNVIDGSAVDLFGHRSSEVTARFVIDTIPPTFLNVTPSDGSTTGEANIVISGSVDDPAANVVLNDNAGNASMGGPNFSFAVELQQGLNTFVLTATDPAGNTSQFQLALTYQPPTQSLQIAQPLPGATIAGDTVVVLGTFGTGPHTGITVNGVAADIIGDEFVANIRLAPGLNTVTVIATTLDGAVDQQQFTVTASGDATLSIDRVAPRRAIMETFAGTGEEGYSGDNGSAIAAQLDFPEVVAVAPDGSLYVSDSGNSVIRRVALDGTITTIAGNGGSDSSGDGGAATAASFDYVYDIVFAPDGSWYVADEARIRRIDTNGIIERIAGFDEGYGGDGGPAIDASFDEYLRLALAPNGTLYIADVLNNRIRHIDTDGIVNTVVGGDAQGYDGDGGPASEALTNGPDALAFGPDGSLYFFDGGNYVIRRIDPAGVISTVAGNGNYGDAAEAVPATAAPLGYIATIVFDSSGNLYLLDSDFAKVRRVTSDGMIETIAGTGTWGYSGDNGPPTQAAFSESYSMAIGIDDTLYIADGGNNRVRGFNVLLSEAETSPLTAGFRLTSDTNLSVSRIDADFNGNGTIDVTVTSERAPLQYEYPAPGVYAASFLVTDRSGNTYTVTSTVAITDVNAADAMFRAIFQTLRDRLRVGNVEGALNVITAGMREKYGTVFNALRPQLATVVDRLGTLEGGTIGDEFAEYVLVRPQGDQSQAFLIYFIKGEDGVWRIDGM